jgi:hypothetical protein
MAILAIIPLKGGGDRGRAGMGVDIPWLVSCRLRLLLGHAVVSAPGLSREHSTSVARQSDRLYTILPVPTNSRGNSLPVTSAVPVCADAGVAGAQCFVPRGESRRQRAQQL